MSHDALIRRDAGARAAAAGRRDVPPETQVSVASG